MPLYGRGRRTSVFSLKHWKNFSRVRKRIIREEGVPRYEREISDWRFTNTSLPHVSENLRVDLEKWTHARFQHVQRPVDVLDWGCGKGRAIRQLAQKLGKHVYAYGYANRGYGRWLRSRNVSFIHEEANELLERVPDQSLDLIYSNHGLYHLQPLYPSPLTPFVQYVGRLAHKLRKGGLFVFNLNHMSQAAETRVITLLGRQLKGFQVQSAHAPNGLRVVQITRSLAKKRPVL